MSSSPLQSFAWGFAVRRRGCAPRSNVVSSTYQDTGCGFFVTGSVLRCCLIAALCVATVTKAGPQAAVNGIALPRFASLKSSPVNMRVGPGTQYDVEWVYVRPRIPLEIYQEYGNWRRVRDWQGTSGWVFGPLLSGRRTAVTAPWSKDKIALRGKPSVSSLVTAWLAPEVIVELVRCDGQWCRVAVNSLAGFVRQTRLWGIYPNDIL
ncbi:aspartyl-trna synthetase [Mesorhizobium sp. B2-3-6]|nr:aspartyl-trna synthetase [Mesorhizobium sp. B263B1A]TPJ92326.1 aspartyl-trna synthetase [Mesorhizobium sp. B2-5-12]TPK21275.1 aspartyl-trna synthetase [Mesorhizobium sp. B2-5-6]TPL21714.1 aspartyl-trna synthetase [Mesorhizobium sp. B2-4-10]TPM23070.1 aspartyl-trna synthetase [Mesorhizobium sp. B2-3-6]TPN32856.1 aspartyl-trna synthetase [Mesorhizobium sp. B1-1-6]